MKTILNGTINRRGVLGEKLAEIGIELVFTWQGAVIAASVVAFPLVFKSARAAFENVDPQLESAARVLGVCEAGVFFQSPAPKLLDWVSLAPGCLACTRTVDSSVGERSAAVSRGLACSGRAAPSAAVNSGIRWQRFIRFVISRGGRRSEGAHARPATKAVCLLLKAPYAGANRIRFQGTLSAWTSPGTPASGAH